MRSALKHFAFLLRESHDTPTCRIFVYLAVQGVATIKGEVLREKSSFRSKKTSKKWVFGVFRSVLKHFAFLLFDSHDTPTCRIFVYLAVQGVATIKGEVLEEKIAFRAQKTSKSWVFDVSRSVLKHFAILLYHF